MGNAQFTGVQAASLSKTNIRTKNARVKLAAINTTAAGTIGSTAWATDMVTQNPTFAQHLELLSARATMLKLHIMRSKRS